MTFGPNSSPNKIVDFVSQKVIQSDNPDEVEIMITPVVYQELARLQNIRNNLKDLRDSGVRISSNLGSSWLAEVSASVSESEHAADQATATLYSETLNDGIPKSSVQVISNLDKVNEVPGVALSFTYAVEESNSNLERGMGRMTERSGVVVRGLMDSAVNSIGFSTNFVDNAVKGSLSLVEEGLSETDLLAKKLVESSMRVAKREIGKGVEYAVSVSKDMARSAKSQIQKVYENKILKKINSFTSNLFRSEDSSQVRNELITPLTLSDLSRSGESSLVEKEEFIEDVRIGLSNLQSILSSSKASEMVKTSEAINDPDGPPPI